MEYFYKAKDRSGASVAGVISDDSKNAAAKRLRGMGYLPVSIEEKAGGGSFKLPAFGLRKSVSLKDVNLFTEQLATMQKVGVPILVSINTLSKQAINPYFKEVLRSIASDVEGGVSMSEAMAKYPGVFSELYVSMLKAGEASGLLVDILTRLKELGQKDMENTARITAATRYPMITFGMLVAAFLIVTTMVIPKFAGIFASFKTELPLPTKIMLGLGYFLKKYWYTLPILFAGLVYAFKSFVSTKGGRLKYDSFLLKTPVFGPLLSILAMSRFARTMAILMRSGLPILQVLEIVSKTVGNSAISITIDNLAVSVKDGKGLAEPMRMTGMFSPMVVQMIAIGEETGKIDELLISVADYYDQQADFTIKNLTTLIEPIFILSLGAMVLVMALAIFLPMWSMMDLFKGG